MDIDEEGAGDVDEEDGLSARHSTRKRKTPPLSQAQKVTRAKPPFKQPKRKSKLRTLAKPKLKLKSQSMDSHDIPTMLNYFEEIEFKGGSRIVNMYDLTSQVMVCLLFSQTLLLSIIDTEGACPIKYRDNKSSGLHTLV